MKAQVSIDGGQAYAPAITRFTQMGTDIGTPSVKTGFTKDIYLTLEKASEAGASEAQVKVFIKPLIVWMWIGGALDGDRHRAGRVPRQATQEPDRPDRHAPVPTEPETAHV